MNTLSLQRPLWCIEIRAPAADKRLGEGVASKLAALIGGVTNTNLETNWVRDIRKLQTSYLRKEEANIRRMDRNPRGAVRYRATIAASSLKVAESRTIADLLLRGVNAHDWRTELVGKNILQIRSLETAERLGQLLRARLELMQPALWEMVRNGSVPLATHACLAAAVKHSPLLGDFLDIAVREQYRLFRPALSNPIWEHFIEDCCNRDPGMPDWSESTVARLRSTVFAILVQAGYVENTRTLKLQTVHVAREVLNYLHEQDEKYVLRCIGVQP